MERDSQSAYNAMFNSFKNPDPRSVGVEKMMESVYPALAKKIFDSRSTLARIVKTGFNPMHILDYPMCSKCEQLAWLDGKAKKNGKWVDVCQCDCGRRTVNPVRFREWVREELKHKAPDGFADSLEYVSDGLAVRMMMKAARDLNNELDKISGKRTEQMGLALPDGSILQPSANTRKPEKSVVQFIQDDKVQEHLKHLNMIEIED